jgi:hypothetical protein
LQKRAGNSGKRSGVTGLAVDRARFAGDAEGRVSGMPNVIDIITAPAKAAGGLVSAPVKAAGGLVQLPLKAAGGLVGKLRGSDQGAAHPAPSRPAATTTAPAVKPASARPAKPKPGVSADQTAARTGVPTPAEMAARGEGRQPAPLGSTEDAS